MSAFTAGNIVVYRVGAGAAALSSSSTAVFLDEYTTGGLLVQSIAVPTAAAGANNPLTASGTATSEGLITESNNGQYLLLTGYDAAPGVAGISGTTSAADQRDVGRVDSQGNVDTGTVLTGFGGGNNIRGVASTDGTGLYVGGGTGVAYTTDDSTAAPNTLDANNTRQIEVVNGQLYYSTGSGNTGIYSLGAGTPTTGTQTGTLLPGTNTNGTSPYAFAFAKLSATTTGNDTLYVADSVKGIEKFSLVNGTWTSNGAIPFSGDTGLTISVTNGTATLYATSPTSIDTYTDTTGYNGAIPANAAPTNIATAGTNEAFRGVAFAPTAAAACYASGTLIRTARGDVAVETLQVGDLAVTASGTHRPIKWIGRRTYDCRFNPGPRAAWPVRVAKDAFGDNLPSRDLYLSPGHSVCVSMIDQILIPIQELVNGSTIAYAPMDEVTYWHVELDSHDILLANDLPAESFLEMGENRALLSDNAAADLPIEVIDRTHADFCRRFIDGGPLLAVARDELARRAIDLGWKASCAIDIIGLIGERRTRPLLLGGEAVFSVPADAGDVTVRTSLTAPTLIGGQDTRRLGLAVYSLIVVTDEGVERHLDLDAPELRASFHDGERLERLHYRWTCGDLVVPRALLAAFDGPLMLRLRYEPSTIRSWRPPSPVAAEARPALRVVA